ncbi:betaine-aldehyde dehydrogenase [Prauserella sediminis]|uniref:Betaine-aldehyde dehydrogenase n=1 Tax=Prauserella sediminis TaxID=577680 RepID=A0A839XNY2_9PSEU|nr:aldehyde dehydrogenase family protein [Prauserella sediminis]MBB3665552.1 betaine-aldehyde dehydrogenase [Prauserella sediminis]
MTLSADPTVHIGRLYIGGEWVHKQRDAPTYEVVSPATGAVVATAPDPTIDDADRAVAAARDAFDHGPWPTLPLAERIEALSRFCDRFEERKEEFDLAWVTESGPTLAHSAALNGGVVLMWRDLLERARSVALSERREVPDGVVDVVREPIGPALVITAWNGPGLYLAMKLVPALLAGCPVVLKMAQESQLTAALVGEMADAAGLPPGVLSVLPASAEVSAHLVEHPGIDKVSLTGSIGAGKAVMSACAGRLANVTLELGGKSPAILLGDVPLEEVLPSLVPGFIAFNGQICAALTRVLVPRARHDEVVAALVARLEAMRVGDPADDSSDLGPLASARQFERVMNYIATGKAEGGDLVLGGGRPDGLDQGFYVAPTVFANVAPDATIAQEEIFGPVLSVIPYDGVDEAVAIANGTAYGLAASVYAADEELARTVAGRIRAGTVAVNTAGVSMFAPFGGFKQSGFGREFGLEGLGEFLQYKSVKVK